MVSGPPREEGAAALVGAGADGWVAAGLPSCFCPVAAALLLEAVAADSPVPALIRPSFSVVMGICAIHHQIPALSAITRSSNAQGQRRVGGGGVSSVSSSGVTGRRGVTGGRGSCTRGWLV